MNLLLHIRDMERFWEKVDIRGDDECWPWKAGRHYSGYGRFWFSKKMYSNTLVFLFGKSEPLKNHALHSCNYSPCCNPNHLYDGTTRQNSIDARNSGKCKLRTPQIICIKILLSLEVKQFQIAKLFNVSECTISSIKNGLRWQEVK